MKKINKRKVIGLILSIIMLILVIKAFSNSRANKLIDITAVISDNSGLLKDEKINIQAINEGEKGISITLPNIVNEKIIEKYYIEEKQINNENKKEKSNEKSDKKTIDIVKENQSKEIEKQDKKEETKQVQKENESKKIENKEKENKEKNIKEKIAGEKIYLTEEEVKNKNIILKVKYESKKIKDKILYKKFIESTEEDRKKELEEEKKQEELKAKETEKNENVENKEENKTNIEEQIEDKNRITIQGFMPENAKIKVRRIKNEEVHKKAEGLIKENAKIKVAYDIKIIVDGIEYEPTNFDENVEVTIKGEDTKKEENKDYKIIHIKEDEKKEKIEKVEEIKEVEVKEDKVQFNAKEFSTYALVEEPQQAPIINNNETANNQTQIPDTQVNTATPYASTSAVIKTEGKWDGATVATKYSYGDGTQAKPYLVADGTELAYLRNEVRNGNTYEGKYFQLASDIDLGNNSWLPIGDANNSFRGTFDGAGHTIANAEITVTSIPNDVQETFGLFGSIGGGNSKTIIRNLELSGIDVTITAGGNTSELSFIRNNGGIYIGTLTGIAYKNSEITNVICKSGTISDTKVITVTNSSFKFSVGGIVGYITNIPGDNQDPGGNARYKMENCFSDITIDLDSKGKYSTGGWLDRTEARGSFHTGGIIGTIASQPKWPTHCLYMGNIRSNGFVGPIFAALVGNTDYSTASGFAKIWNGNDAGGKLKANNIYYSNFSINGRTFNQTVEKGNSTVRINSNQNNIGSVQGINKGIYTTDMNLVLNTFNGNVNQNNKYVNWNYINNTFTFKERLTTTVDENPNFQFNIIVNDPYNINNYTYTWYKDGVIDNSISGNAYMWTPNYEKNEDMVVITYDGNYYSIVKFLIKKISVDIVFDIDTVNNRVVARLEGEGLKYTTVDDYTFQWYKEDMLGNGGPINGATTLTLEGLEKYMDYKLVGINHKIPQLTTENGFTYGGRNVIFLDQTYGNDGNDGFTDKTAVKTIERAYSKLENNVDMKKNIIVVIGNYSNSDFLNYENSSEYSKNVTITGKYKKKDYNARLELHENYIGLFGGLKNNFLNGDTTFQHIILNGNRNSLYLYLQGYSLEVGENVTMENYDRANANQGLLGNNAPAVHIIAGWLKYDETKLPRNNAKIIIKSGTYGRIIGGGSPGYSGASNLLQNTSHNFMGTAEESFNIDITIDIKNSTNKQNYDYDVNLLVGGSACGNNYSVVTENIKSGTIGRLLGGSIGDSGDRPDGWQYPINTFLGDATINVEGGKIQELYGGCLGRNMNAIDGGRSTILCDSYYYGKVNLNMTGGEITGNIYGAGAGGVTGYSTNSSDVYKSYGEKYKTEINLNISGGKIGGNIYGGGYGYTEYLTEKVTQPDGGALYGNSNISIKGSPTINGNIYGAGCGYNLQNKNNLAKMEGTSSININGTPTIAGEIFGAGQGIQGKAEMAKLVGTSNITVSSNLNTPVYGGGNISKTTGQTNVNIQNGNHTGDIYGGGNKGIIEGTTNVKINGGSSNRIFGGGNQATVTTSIVDINGGTNNQVFAGGNLSEVQNPTVNINGGNTTDVFGGGNKASVNQTKVYLKGGTVKNIYGGSNELGNVQATNIETKNGTAENIYGGNNLGGSTNNTNVLIDGGSITNVYGGGNQVEVPTTKVELRNSTNTITNVFGGGNKAGATTTNVLGNGGKAINIFGGSNLQGTVTNSNVTITNGIYENVYGGNNLGGSTNNTNVLIDGGSITNIYGGGNQVEVPTTKVELRNSTNTITNVFGGGNKAGVTTTNVLGNGGKATNIFGGSNLQGTVTNSNVTITNGIYENVYGGNNNGGKTITTNVIVKGPGTTNVYGGGNQAVTNLTNVTINSEVKGNLYGGGNQAGVETNTNLDIIGGTIFKNAYGGGNQGTVSKDTFVHVKNSKLNESVYAGGNGSTAIVYGNTNILVDGTTTTIQGSVFGGGNQAETGDKNTQNSLSTVNIAGGKIGKNVYGGANTSVVNGRTKTNIGVDTINKPNIEIGDVLIEGTIFGGGEANAAGDENYDFSFISVTKGIDIYIDGNKHNNFNIYGSIFGSGNASSTTGQSYIYINNYGTFESPQSNISLQRANLVTITNSAMKLSGATDRTNEFSTTFFAISRVDRIKLIDNSTLFLCNGANLLKNLDSIAKINGVEEKAKVTINPETGEVTEKNVNNRIYMLEGKNLNIATNEQVTAYGKVSGMMFFGLFNNRNNPSTSTGLYNKIYNNGDKITNAGTFISNAYVMAQHMPNHNTEIDGFYTNYNEKGNIRVKYIDVTPKEDKYYMWLVGEKKEVTVFDVGLIASKYATLGTHELLLKGFSDPNIKFSLIGFSSGLDKKIELVEPDIINAIEPNENIANNRYGLQIKTGNLGWQTKGETTFYTKDGGTYSGKNDYDSDNSPYTPTLNICLYHAENITEAKNLGEIRIMFEALTPIDELNYKVSYIDINITMISALYQEDFYEAAITPGQEFGLFTTTETTISGDSAFSTYYSLYIENFNQNKHYKGYKNNKRVLVSRDSNQIPYVFPENTKLTMLDMVTNKYYYYIVTANDVATGKYTYPISDFILMGSTDNKFDEQVACDNYYNTEQNIVYENFIFHVNFADATIPKNIEKNTLLMEMQDLDGNTLLGVLGIQRNTIAYSVYNNQNAKITLSGKLSKNVLYLGQKLGLDVVTDFDQLIVNSKTVYDTHYFDKKLGIKISIYDSNGKRLNNDTLLGVNFELNGERYYPRIDGTTRIKISDKVTNVLAKLKVHTENNNVLPTGDYKIRIESFGSADGIYYGINSSDMIELDLKVINSTYGLKVKTIDNEKIIDKTTGNNTDGKNTIDVNIEYESLYTNPNIRVSLYRRDYQDIYSQKYNIVNLQDYVTEILKSTKNKNEYIAIENLTPTSKHTFTFKQNLTTGTYKLVYKLYDGENYIGEAYEYIVIK